MKSNQFFLKLHYIKLKSTIFQSLKKINDTRINDKDTIGIYAINNLSPIKLIKSFAEGINEGFYVFLYSTNNKIHRKKLTLINELTNIYGVFLIIFEKNNIIKLFNNNCNYINLEKSLKNRVFSINSNKISFLLPEELANPAVLMTLKMQEIDIIFVNSYSNFFNQDVSNILLSYVITDKNIYTPAIFDEKIVVKADKNKIILNMGHLKTIKNNYLETNYNDLNQIKSKINLI
ncbi:hypothetical protein [Petrotoga sp. 9PWA.NaAc.5.4]|uniref:hypothetical protein n=1 Tax=Petrotoga sp. 9PWA.NaAc.5.4 TaxID=1434328 RepID=UPI000CC793E3|nr:hypothetical protein [Petrotoga sp. 9PWA.NaAc.5.4]PNR97226.1 hypothetical protein X924_00915 [Petrotoga sp. 9PWA.NaAc.5.4]